MNSNVSCPVELTLKYPSICFTGGDGLHSSTRRSIKIQGFILYVFSDCANLEVIFDSRFWNISVDGFIYTDKTFLSNLKKMFLSIGFSQKAIDTVEYSEMDMQGKNYIHLDIGLQFCIEFSNLPDVIR